MKSLLAISFGGVADRERKHPDEEASGMRGARAPRRRIDWAFLGRLAFGPGPIGHPDGGLSGLFWAGRLLGLVPSGAHTEDRPGVPGPAGF